MRVTVNVDGGARGNPGPAAAACVVSDVDGAVLLEDAELLGEATNNVAEYRALLLGLERARELGADAVDVIGDSELVARQIEGRYSVKHPALKPLLSRRPASAARLPGVDDPDRAAGRERPRRRARQCRARRAS